MTKLACCIQNFHKRISQILETQPIENCDCWCHQFPKTYAQIALGIIRIYCAYPSRPKWWTHTNDLQVEQWLLGINYSIKDFNIIIKDS